jgi:ABC-2 type transport system ATP-binding protein
LEKLADRDNRKLSGGQQQRLLLAIALVNDPALLFLDEPTTGLDPQARRNFWELIQSIKARKRTLILTTHYMDEAEHCDRIAVIDHGKIVGLDTPDGLKHDIGGDVITLQADDTAGAAAEIRERYGIPPTVAGDAISFQVARGEEFLPDFVRTLSRRIRSIGLRRPTLEDVFLHLTGREIRDEGIDEQQAMVARFARWR